MRRHILAALLAAWIPLLPPGARATALPVARNLLVNSSFEVDAGLGGPAEGWNVLAVPEGGANEPTPAKARTGRFSHGLTVPQGTRVDWYQVNREVPGAASGRTYTLSVYAQTQDVRDGAGAYCSINCFDAGGARIGVFDADAKVTGTVAEWRRQSVTATLPPGTIRTVVIFTLHGHGAAWFDDAQLEEGSAATDYGPSAADLEAAQESEREREEAQAFLRTAPVTTGARGKVAILRDTLPASGRASSPDRLGGWLKQAGYAVTYLNARQIANRFILRGPSPIQNPKSKIQNAFDLLVLPCGASFPAAAVPNFKRYLRQGGAFLSTGGYAFDSLLIPYNGKWYRPADLPLPQTPETPVLKLTPGAEQEWQIGSDPGGTNPVLTTEAGPSGGLALRFTVNPLSRWATASIHAADRLPKNWAITRFRARGDGGTPKMVVEWHEMDGSRWKATVPLTTRWKEYVLKINDFAYWPDNPSVGRGYAEDHLRPAYAARLLIGLAEDIADAGRPHSFWIADVTVQPDPLASLRAAPSVLNTRYAPIRDAMFPSPDQIPVFDPSHPLRFARAARASAGQFVAPPDLRWRGPFEGYCAVGMISNQGHGFGPNLARLIPLLDAVDRYGRFRGPLGSVMHAYAGYYAGASWAFFGASNRDLFGPEFPQARPLFLNTVAHLMRRCYLHDTDTEFSGYRPGEPILLRAQVSDFGRQRARAQVIMEAFAESGGHPVFTAARALTLEPGRTEPVAISWKPPQEARASLYRIRATLRMNGRPVDREENAVVIWSEEAWRGLTPVTERNAYFDFGGRPLFALGCQTYWGQNGSVTARSPLAFARDFAMMQDYGLRFSRAFISFRTDGERRQSDAIVQLAQQHRILLYHAPNLFNTAVPEELAGQEDIARALGERYRGIPRLMVDISNEPYFQVADERLVPAFNEFLRARYGTTERLRQAWGPDAPEIGQAKPARLSDRWDDLRARDTHLFLADAQEEWATRNRAALRSDDGSRLVSVGFMQSYGDGATVWDPLIGSRDLDFTDRHYYGPLSDFPMQLKDMDMRALGKAMAQGECGAKNHPTYIEKNQLGEDDAAYDRRFLYLVHHAFGLGAAALSSWHWRDPMEGIFPCGLVHADRVPRPAASVMRAQAIAFGRLRPTHETPSLLLVVPENHRLGGSRAAVTTALHRAEELLMGCHVDFGLISENLLDRLPTGVRALVYPVPYCPSDETVTRLLAFVRGGGALYFSGDISYDPDRRLTRAQRLPELAGVERLGERYPNIAREKAGAVVLRQTSLPELAGGEARPALTVRAVDVEVLAAGDDLPVVTACKLGMGFVFYCADPVELSGPSLSWHRALYLNFLRHAEIARNPVLPDAPRLRCFRVPLEGGGQAFVLYNDGDSGAQATVASVTIHLAPRSPGLIVTDGRGRLTTVEAQGAVSRDGRPLLTVRGHAIVQCLDGRDLADSRRLLILPLPGEGASVSMPSLASMRTELGELRQTRWTRLETLHAGREGGLSLDAEQALNMVLAAAPGEFAQAVNDLEQSVRGDSR